MTPLEYESKQKRLKEIENKLKIAADEENIESIKMTDIIKLRDEARVIAKELNTFIQENFKI